MTTSPDEPKGTGDPETESLPWQPSPGPLAADGVVEGPQEAVGGGSHQASGEAARTSASQTAEATGPAAGRAMPITDDLKDAIIAEPLKAVSIAALVGFLAAAILWR
jgi:hypothetical protein